MGDNTSTASEHHKLLTPDGFKEAKDLSTGDSLIGPEGRLYPIEMVFTPEGHQPAIIYRTRRIKPLAELRASDVPHGIDPYDLATDCH